MFMKTALVSLLLAGVSLGSLKALAPSDGPGCSPADCHMKVECTPQGTCIVTCSAKDGSIICQKEIPCDGPCPAQAGSTAGDTKASVTASTSKEVSTPSCCKTD